MFCITYDTTCYADLQRAFDSFMRQLRELFGPVLRVRKNKRIVSHPQPHRVGKYHAPHLRPDPHPHLPRDRLQGYHSEPEIPPEGSCSRADEAQDDSDTDNTDEGDHLWLRTYEGHDILKDWHVDYTDQVPSCGAVFPQGLQEIERSTYITGAVCVTNQSNFGLYFTFAKSAGDDEGAKINADWVNGFQHWVQEQSAHGLAPNFGDAEEPVIARAQNGVLYEAEAEGTATYMVVLSLRYTKTYESEDFA